MFQLDAVKVGVLGVTTPSEILSLETDIWTAPKGSLVKRIVKKEVPPDSVV